MLFRSRQVGIKALSFFNPAIAICFSVSSWVITRNEQEMINVWFYIFTAFTASILAPIFYLITYTNLIRHGKRMYLEEHERLLGH